MTYLFLAREPKRKNLSGAKILSAQNAKATAFTLYQHAPAAMATNFGIAIAARKIFQFLTKTKIMEVLPRQCKRNSRTVKEEDMKRVKKEGKEMIGLCRKPLGRYPYALALAHCQVDHDDPLRFFVFNSGKIIINPTIEEVGEGFIRDTEGCFSYPFRAEVSMKRWASLKVSYTEITAKGKKEEKTEVIDGMLARIFQHEIDHMDSMAIYPR